MADAAIYYYFKNKENTVGLTESEEVKMGIVERSLFELLDSLEMAVLGKKATIEEKIQINYLRNLLLTKAVVR